MAEYIEREKFRKHIQDVTNDPNCPMYIAVTIEQYIDEEPAADVAPVVQGRWVRIYENGEPAIEQHQVGVCCSKCIKMPKDKFTESDYCPNCGAKMDGGQNANT